MGDYVLVHAGFAIAVIDEAEAQRTLACLAIEPGGAGAVKYVDEYRDADGRAAAAPTRSRGLVTRPWTLMEICGGQTHSIVRHGIDRMLPEGVTLLHGPGCPVCVTPAEVIDAGDRDRRRARGDPLLLRRHAAGAGRERQPARGEGARRRCAHRLFAARRRGARASQSPSARWCSSPSASRPPRRPRPWRCCRPSGRGCAISRLLVAARAGAAGDRGAALRPGQPRAGLPRRRACLHRDGLLTNTSRSRARYGVPIVVTGFEPLDLLQGILPVRPPARGGPRRGREPVRPLGPPRAATWRPRRRSRRVYRGRSRGPGAGSARSRRAASAWPRPMRGSTRCAASAPSPCRPRRAPASASAARSCAAIRKPADCPAFGTRCTPEHPLGATMVSSEGACAAYYRYRAARSAA